MLRIRRHPPFIARQIFIASKNPKFIQMEKQNKRWHLVIKKSVKIQLHSIEWFQGSCRLEQNWRKETMITKYVMYICTCTCTCIYSFSCALWCGVIDKINKKKTSNIDIWHIRFSPLHRIKTKHNKYIYIYKCTCTILRILLF